MDGWEALADVRRAVTDEARPEAVAKQHGRGRWTARERIAGLVDVGTFVEYGALATPAARDLDGAADGLVMGHATVDGQPVCVMGYDYTVHAGTQSQRNHRKIDRMLDLARRHRWPLVVWSEGGGMRPHELTFGGLTSTFTALACLSGVVPSVAIVPGRAFAGHANIAGLVDISIATRNACMGMAGPALVEAATGERLTPEELGPIELHESTGAVDLVVDDEEAAIEAARAYLSYFLPAATVIAPDTTVLRGIVPANPRQAYDVRAVIDHVADVASALELRPRFGRAVVTALCRIGGHPVGVIANQPSVLAGAIDADASDKITRFVQLCDAHDVPLVYLVDTPGFMVGRETEHTALVRHSARTILALANATVPILTVVLRKAYGLGYYAMGGPAFHPALIVGWPTAQFGAMGFEGAAALMMTEDRASTVEDLRTRNTGLAYARGFAIDDLVDPADTRDLLVRTLDAVVPVAGRGDRKHPVDAW